MGWLKSWSSFLEEKTSVWTKTTGEGAWNFKHGLTSFRQHLITSKNKWIQLSFTWCSIWIVLMCYTLFFAEVNAFLIYFVLALRLSCTRSCQLMPHCSKWRSGTVLKTHCRKQSMFFLYFKHHSLLLLLFCCCKPSSSLCQCNEHLCGGLVEVEGVILSGCCWTDGQSSSGPSDSRKIPSMLKYKAVIAQIIEQMMLWCKTSTLTHT